MPLKGCKTATPSTYFPLSCATIEFNWPTSRGLVQWERPKGRASKCSLQSCGPLFLFQATLVFRHPLFLAAIVVFTRGAWTMRYVIWARSPDAFVAKWLDVDSQALDSRGPEDFRTTWQRPDSRVPDIGSVTYWLCGNTMATRFLLTPVFTLVMHSKTCHPYRQPVARH